MIGLYRLSQVAKSTVLSGSGIGTGTDLSLLRMGVQLGSKDGSQRLKEDRNIIEDVPPSEHGGSILFHVRKIYGITFHHCVQILCLQSTA